jgi:hypothetical protein
MTVIVKDYFRKTENNIDLIAKAKNSLYDKFSRQFKMLIMPNKIIYCPISNVFFLTLERANDVRKLQSGEFSEIKTIEYDTKYKKVFWNKGRWV